MKKFLLAAAIALLSTVAAQEVPQPTDRCRIIIYAEYWTPLWNMMKDPVRVTINNTEKIEIIPTQQYVIVDAPPGRYSVDMQWQNGLSKNPQRDGVSLYLGAGKSATMRYLINNTPVGYLNVTGGQIPLSKLGNRQAISMTFSGSGK